MRGLVEGLLGRVLAEAEADLDGLDGIRLFLLLLELVEDLGRLVGGRGPDDLEAGKGEGEEDELGLEVGWVRGRCQRGRGVVGERVESEGFVLVELDEEHGVFVMLQHRFRLVEETAVLERGDEIPHGFALDANLRREHVVTYSKHAGYDDHRMTMQEGRQRGAELANVDYDAGRLCCSGQTATASNASVHCTEKLFLGIVRAFPIKGKGYGHLLSTC